MQAAPSIKSTTERATVASTYKPVVKLTAHRGWYRVQSGSNPSVYYDTSANSCTCPARKPCKHQKFVRSLNVAFFVKEAEAPVVVPMTAGAPSGIVLPVMPPTVVASLDAETDAAEMRLASARRALADTDSRADEYAGLWCQVDRLERAVAALHYELMRAA